MALDETLLKKKNPGEDDSREETGIEALLAGFVRALLAEQGRDQEQEAP